MKQNPCRYCALSIVYKNRHEPSSNFQCGKCENIKKHREYLKEHRMFEKGNKITDLEELQSQEWVMWGDRAFHIAFLVSMPLRTITMFLKKGCFYKAIRKESEEK